MSLSVETFEISQWVERYAEKEYADAERYENRSLLDESGMHALHELVAKAYAAGWDAGHLICCQNTRFALRHRKTEEV